MTKLYIAGPITGIPNFKERFSEAEVLLSAAGYDVLNPCKNEDPAGKRTWLNYMKMSLRDIADADGIAFLKGWVDSRGATIEVQLGMDLGMPTKKVDQWLEEA